MLQPLQGFYLNQYQIWNCSWWLSVEAQNMQRFTFHLISFVLFMSLPDSPEGWQETGRVMADDMQQRATLETRTLGRCGVDARTWSAHSSNPASGASQRFWPMRRNKQTFSITLKSVIIIRLCWMHFMEKCSMSTFLIKNVKHLLFQAESRQDFLLFFRHL